MCVRRGGLAGEDGGGCPWAGVSGGGEDGLLLWGKGAARLYGFGVGLGCPCRIGGDVCVAVVSLNRKASKADSPPLMVRMCVGPCGEGANWTRHLVLGGGGQPSWVCLWGALLP